VAVEDEWPSHFEEKELITAEYNELRINFTNLSEQLPF
jgi:hypothetical protein